MKIYVIGSLRNPRIPEIGNVLRDNGFDVFDDWFAGGYEADDKWQEYEHKRGRSYKEALRGENARHIYEFDLSHLDTSDAGVLVMPAGRSAHLELGYLRGQGKKTYVLFDKEPDRFDVMYRFADDVFFSTEEMIDELNREMGSKVLETGGAYKSVVQRPEYEGWGRTGTTGPDHRFGGVQRFSPEPFGSARAIPTSGDEVFSYNSRGDKRDTKREG